ncbi:MAG: glutathione synthase [Gammaproteobacteria bacterium]|nr:glutathione synthase [Gammaproteobacteria bacterium]MDH5239672.1 glutathione synthase [Gammaproteobacteria bacterium]MDH5260111.1 glutathione synthase [Gammaproteobacteria bacterium]MDH5582252.1 glutathione synthase [Gammaproteobacteria bacterium]
MKLGIVMDPIRSITPKKDSSLAMLLEASRRGAELHYFEQQHLRMLSGKAIGISTQLTVRDNYEDWFDLGQQQEVELGELDVILMRKDPPFNMEYVYTTYILDRAKLAGALVVNAPQALRDMNEKAYTGWFPECTPVTLVTRSMPEMKAFLAKHGRIVVKPLDGMGGRSIFVIQKGDNNANVILETLTDYGQRFAIAQVYIPEISAGDKRILLIDGEPVPYALARIPSPDDNRGNMVAGATTRGQPLSAADVRICEIVGPVLRDQGVLFAGLDVIGDYLTEVNVTSPTGIRELDREFGLNIAGLMFDAIEKKLR